SRETPSTSARSSSASSRGVSLPPAPIAVSAPCSASRTEVPPPACATALLRSSGRGLGLEAPPALVGLQRGGDLVELALEHLVEVVDGDLDSVVGDPALAVVVGPDLLSTVASADLRAAVRGELGLLFGERALVQPRAKHPKSLVPVLEL